MKVNKPSTTLAIETSCDDTSLSIVRFEDGIFHIDELISYSQTTLHAQYGGVMPEIAYRSHAEKIIEMMHPHISTWCDRIDSISVTSHPWLPGSLIVGITTAHMLGALRDKPVIECNHIMGHVFSILCERHINTIALPYLCLTVSGWHNDIYLVTDTKQSYIPSAPTHTKHNHIPLWWSLQLWPYTITKISQTMDDAAGECFDKVARMLWGPYPWGKWIDDLAKLGNPDTWYQFRAGSIDGQPLLFSYSGIKSQVHNLIHKLWDALDEQTKANIALAFQNAVCQDLLSKLELASHQYHAKTIGIVGWVSANSMLKNYAHDRFEHTLFPSTFVYCTDNAAMIGVVWLLQEEQEQN